MQLPRNRRAAKRRVPKRSTKVIVPKGRFGLGQNVALSLLDLSETGARLLVKEELAIGQEVEVSLEGMQLLRPLKLAATVLWSIATAEGAFCIGLRFDKVMPFSSLQALVAT